MPVETFALGDRFRITTVKYLAANPDRRWDNNYELRAKAGGSVTDLTQIGLKIVALEQALHADKVRFDRMRMSTWEEDSDPYDPGSFVSLPLSGSGLRDTSGGQVLALNVCYHVARVPISGRFGAIFYRGALTEGEVEAPAGKFILTSLAAEFTLLNAALDDSGMGDVLNGDDPIWEIVMVNATGSNTRVVLGLVPRGVAVVPFSHAWYNRNVSP